MTYQQAIKLAKAAEMEAAQSEPSQYAIEELS